MAQNAKLNLIFDHYRNLKFKTNLKFYVSFLNLFLLFESDEDRVIFRL